jgi:ABC-type uncharacterized transport system substrate-binding protein
VLIRTTAGLGQVRPYIEGLISGLTDLKRQLGTDFEIDYRELEQQDLENAETAADAFKAKPGEKNDLIFTMSTTALRAARGITESTPIVFPSVSDFKADGINLGNNATGVSARRSQSAGQCFERFLATVPALNEVRCLYKPGYPPGERALKLVNAAAKKQNITIKTGAVRSHQDIEKAISAMTTRDLKKPADMGILVLPVDLCLSAASIIIDLAQGQKKIPTFFPVTDWVKKGLPSALGAYGVPQRACGRLTGDYVDQILWRNVTAGTLKVKDAPDDAFEWVVSREAAKALNITIPDIRILDLI